MDVCGPHAHCEGRRWRTLLLLLMLRRLRLLMLLLLRRQLGRKGLWRCRLLLLLSVAARTPETPRMQLTVLLLLHRGAHCRRRRWL